MRYAVHSYYAEAIAINEDGEATNNGTVWYELPEPLYVSDTMKDAELWRKLHTPKN